MHQISINDKKIRTDLLLEQYNLNSNKSFYKNIEINNNKYNKYNYTTIYYEDITDRDNYNNLKYVFKKELLNYLNINKDDTFLIIGLGNNNSTPDSLGPKVIDNILVTRYLFNIGDVLDNYSNVAAYKPDVSGNTGIESIMIVKDIIRDIEPTKVLIIDSLKANKLDRLIKTIQITNSGIHPGSGIFNDRGELSKKTMGCDIIAIGIPTVVDIKTITNKKNTNNYLVTPTNIDFVIDRLSNLISTSINELLHTINFDN